MAVYLAKEKIEEIFKKYGGSEGNTGSTEGQIALFTYRIKMLSDHLQKNKKDHSCRTALLTIVGKRKRLLNYLAKKDIQKLHQKEETLNIDSANSSGSLMGSYTFIHSSRVEAFLNMTCVQALV